MGLDIEASMGIGGGTPMNLYSIRQYPDRDAAYIRQ
jgi:hypothetical protein